MAFPQAVVNDVTLPEEVLVAFKENNVTAKLPKDVMVTLDNGNVLKETISWDLSNIDTAVSGDYKVKGTVLGKEVELRVFVQADKTALKKIIEQADTYEADAYTEESYLNLMTVVTKAREVLKDDKATQDAVNAQVTAIEKAISALKKEETPIVVDKAELKNALDEAKAIQAEGFTSASYAKLQKAIKAAEKVYADAAASQDDVKVQVKNIQKAIQSLEAVSQTSAKAILQNLVEKAEKKKESAYTAASWKTFEKALKDAKNILQKKDATKVEIQQAYETLVTALQQLKAIEQHKKEPVNTTDKTDTPKTGDTSQAQTAGIMVILSGAVLAVLRKKRKYVEE